MCGFCILLSNTSTGHVIEEEKDAESGVEFLTSSRENWKDSLYGGHLTWHLALYHLGKLITRVCSYRNLAYNECLHPLPFGRSGQH